MTQFQKTADGLSALQAFPNERYAAHCRVDTATTQVPFKSFPRKRGLQVTNIRVLCEDGTPTETYQIYARMPNMDAPYLWWSQAITVVTTDSPQDDLYIPAGTTLFGVTVGGKDGNLYVIGDEYGKAR